MNLFPSVPEDLESVSADDLQGLLDEFKTIGASLAADMQRPVDERELIPADATPASLTEELAAAASEKSRIETHLAGLAEAEETFTAAFNEGLAALGVEVAPAATLEAEGEGEGEGEGDEKGEGDEEGEGESEGEGDAAATQVGVAVEVEAEAETPAPRMSIPRGSAKHAPKPAVPASSVGATVVATRGLGAIKVREGTPFTRGDYAGNVIELAKRLGRVQHVKDGGRDKHSVAIATFEFPEEFTLSQRDWDQNIEKIRAVSPLILGQPTELEVFQAAGGICAPPTPFYDVPGFASRARPVRDGLPSYNAVRGGVSIPSVNIVDRTDSGVTIIEESEDAQGGTFSVKACRSLECAEWTDTFVGIISHCLEVGNLNARTWPEGVALENDNLMSGWAASADTRLLNRIRALSVKSDTVHTYNAVHDMIYGILRVKAAIRSLLRAEMDAQFTALIPEWLPELMVSDLAAQSALEDRYVATSAISAYLTRLGVTPVWYKDSPTSGVSQIFAAQTDGETEDTLSFPLVAQVGLFLNGTFIHLDGGSLELGLVRDSSLNHSNDYELFGESFENVARIGPAQAARWLNMTICPSGQFPALATALSCS